MKQLNINYLGTEHLNGFDTYKYSSVDTSPISIYLTHPFWEWCVQVFVDADRWLIGPEYLSLDGRGCTYLWAVDAKDNQSLKGIITSAVPLPSCISVVKF